MSESDTPNAKVLFRVPEDDGSANVETLWATDQLNNSPFYAYSVSWQDVVFAPHDPAEGFPTFQRVLRKSGNRTVRVLLSEPAQPGNTSDAVLDGLVALGCDYEGANRTYISVNVPPTVVLDHVRDYLVRSGVQWEHADPTYAELHPDSD
jgi:hypothetical protein